MKAVKLDALKQFSLSLIRYSSNLELAETSRFASLFPRLLVVMTTDVNRNMFHIQYLLKYNYRCKIEKVCIMIKKISSIVILVCIILFNITPIVMAADYAELGDSSSASGRLSE